MLHYAPDSIAGPPWLFTVPGSGDVLLETCWWVPIAFGGAGVILGAAHPLLDRAWGGGPRRPPGWPTVLVSIAAFIACYDLSGQLAQETAARGGAHEWIALDVPLRASASVESGALHQRALDAGLELISGLFRKYVLGG